MADPESETWFEVRFDVRFVDGASEWSAGPWQVAAGTTQEITVSVPSELMLHPAQAEVLTWIGATVVFADAGGAPLGSRHLTGGLTVESSGIGFLTEARAEAVAPGRAYEPSSLALLSAAQEVEGPGVVMELSGGVAATAVGVSAEEVAP